MYFCKYFRTEVKRILQPVVSLLMLVLFLTGTTGISFYIHTCSETHKRNIYAFPELVKPVSDCCTEDAISPMAENCNHPLGVDAACCKNEHIYLKAAFVSVPVTLQDFSILLNDCYFPHSTKIIFPVQDNTFRDELLFSGNSPPISGKTLVFFIHQIRIPSPASLS